MKSKKKLFLVFVCATLFSYAIRVGADIIRPSFNLASDYCLFVDVVRTEYNEEIGEEYDVEECTVFKNDVERQKYYYNRALASQNGGGLFLLTMLGSGLFGLLVVRLLFPTQERTAIIGSPFFAVVVIGSISTVGAFMLSYILPAPSSHLPFIEYQHQRWSDEMEVQLEQRVVTINEDGVITRQ